MIRAKEVIGIEEKAEDDAKHAMNIKKMLKGNPYFRKIKKFQMNKYGKLNSNSPNCEESGSTQIDI